MREILLIRSFIQTGVVGEIEKHFYDEVTSREVKEAYKAVQNLLKKTEKSKSQRLQLIAKRQTDFISKPQKELHYTNRCLVENEYGVKDPFKVFHKITFAGLSDDVENFIIEVDKTIKEYFKINKMNYWLDYKLFEEMIFSKNGVDLKQFTSISDLEVYLSH